MVVLLFVVCYLDLEIRILWLNVASGGLDFGGMAACRLQADCLSHCGASYEAVDQGISFTG